MELKINTIEFELIQTDYEKIDVVSEGDVLLFGSDRLSARYNYFLVMRHNPEFRHYKSFKEGYEGRWSNKSFFNDFSQNDIMNELTYEEIQINALTLLKNKFPEFDNFKLGIHRFSPEILAENTFMSLFAFDAQEDKEQTVKDSLNSIADELTEFYEKNKINFKLKLDVQKVSNNKVVLKGPQISEFNFSLRGENNNQTLKL